MQVERDLARGGHVLERQRAYGRREPGEHLGLEPFDVDFDERGLAVALDQRLQRHDLDACAALPAHVLKARLALHALRPIRCDSVVTVGVRSLTKSSA